MKWVQVYDCILGKKKLRTNLDVATEECKKVLEEMKKFLKVPKRETPELKVVWELEVTATKVKLKEADTVLAIAIGACYDLFRQLPADDPQVQWDRIVRPELHKNNPWTALNGTKHKGLRMKTFKSLQDCIMFHKLTVFSVDAAERQKSYMMGRLKKPHGMSIKKHVSCFKMMNGCISQLIAYAVRQLTCGCFHQEGECTIQQSHTG